MVRLVIAMYELKGDFFEEVAVSEMRRQVRVHGQDAH
jgi:hypothetical protein